MAVNEVGRQLEIATEIEDLTRTLAHSTRDVPKPRESYKMLGELGAVVDNLAQVMAQLGAWHARAEDGIHYSGEDGGTTGSAQAAADELRAAAGSLREASEAISRAHSRNSVVRWYPDDLFQRLRTELSEEGGAE